MNRVPGGALALALALSLAAAGCGGSDHSHKKKIPRPHGPSGAGQEGPQQKGPENKGPENKVAEAKGNRGKPLGGHLHARLTAKGSGAGAALTVLVKLNGKSRHACWSFGRLPTSGQHTAAFGHVSSRVVPTNASINRGTVRRARGPVLVALGVRYTSHGCTPVASSVINAILSAPSDYYVAVNSTRYPKGRLRGQL